MTESVFEEIRRLKARVEELGAFYAAVHARLDAAGVPPGGIDCRLALVLDAWDWARQTAARDENFDRGAG